MGGGVHGVGATVGGVFGCMGPFRPEQCGWVRIGGGGGAHMGWGEGQLLRTALHTISICLQNSL